MAKRKYLGKVPPPPKKKKAPDINTALIRNRNNAITSWHEGKVDPCYNALDSINKLLPPAYRVEFKQIPLGNRNSFSNWFWDTLSNIESKMGRFRDNNWTKEE